MKNNETIRNYSPALSYAMKNNIWLCRRYSPSLLANRVNRQRYFPRSLEVRNLFKNKCDYFVTPEGLPYRTVLHVKRNEDNTYSSELLSRIYEAIRCKIEITSSYRGSEYVAIVFTRQPREISE